jgi:hypothetical protein
MGNLAQQANTDPVRVFNVPARGGNPLCVEGAMHEYA